MTPLARMTGALVASFAFSIAAAVLFLDREARFAVSIEGGPIETLTFLAFLLGSGIALLAWRIGASPSALAGALGLAVGALRELDIHKAFTSGSITSTRFYLGDAPFAEKLFGLVALGSTLWIVALLLRAVPSWFGRLRSGDAHAWMLALGLGALGLGMGLDALGRVFPAIEPVRSAYYDVFVLVEESVELAGAALLFAAAVATFAGARRASRAKSP